MQVKRSATLSLCALALAAGGARGGVDVDDQEVNLLFHYFADVEDVRVRSHYVDYGLKLGERLRLDLEFNHERVSIPAVEAPAGSEEAVDAITSASRPIADAGDAYRDYTKLRNSLQADLDLGGGRLGFYRSQEVDYDASLLTARVDRDFQDAQLNLALGGGYGWDHVAPLDDADTAGAADDKRTLHLNAVATRILDPSTLLRLGVELNQIDGLQHNAYRNVYAGGTHVPERHPDARRRGDVFVKLNRYLGERSSLGLDYRYYRDDWRLRSHAWSARLSQYLGDELVLRYRYRFYRQNAAWFWADEYAAADGIDGYRSADYRLGDFDAHLFGTRLEWTPGRLGDRLSFLRRSRVRIGYERYFNSNDFAANVFETGLNLEF